MMNQQTNEAAPAADQSFLRIIHAHKSGSVITEVSQALKQLTAAVQNTSRPGKVALVMTLRPAGQNSSGTLVFEPKVKATIPEVPAPASIFYADADFNLVREDPNQTKLDLRVVEPAQPVELRKVVGA